MFVLFVSIAVSGHYIRPRKKSRPSRPKRKYFKNGGSPQKQSEVYSSKEDSISLLNDETLSDYEPLESSSIEITKESYIRESIEGCFSSPSAGEVKVRGANYLNDKVKVFSAPSLMRFVHTYSFTHIGELVHDTTVFDWCWWRRAQPAPESFTFIINFQLAALHKQIISYFYIEDKEKLPESVKLFFERDDDYRNSHFKMIPKLVKAPLPIRLATPMAPVIICRKIDVDWIRGGNYLSIIMKPDSSLLAANIIRMAHPVSKNVIVDLFFCVEGKLSEHLPEHVLCGIRWERLNLKQFQKCKMVKLSGSKTPQLMKDISQSK